MTSNPKQNCDRCWLWRQGKKTLQTMTVSMQVEEGGEPVHIQQLALGKKWYVKPVAYPIRPLWSPQYPSRHPTCSHHGVQALTVCYGVRQQSGPALSQQMLSMSPWLNARESNRKQRNQCHSTLSYGQSDGRQDMYCTRPWSVGRGRISEDRDKQTFSSPHALLCKHKVKDKAQNQPHSPTEVVVACNRKGN